MLSRASVTKMYSLGTENGEVEIDDTVMNLWSTTVNTVLTARASWSKFWDD